LNGRHLITARASGQLPKGVAILVAMACLSVAGTGWAGAIGRDSGPVPASIVIVSVDVSPNERNDVAKDSVATFRINVVLHNDGEANGTVLLKITGMKGTFVNESITLGGNGTADRTYDWKLQGDRRHTAMVSITGDVGEQSNMPAAADLHYKAATPGFGALLLAGAMGGAAVAVRGQRRK
jgi:hypothetical protein